MTYNADYERSRMSSAEIGDYPNQPATKPVSGKWLMISLVLIFGLFGALAFFAGDTSVTIEDGNMSKPLATETQQPAPTAPATD